MITTTDSSYAYKIADRINQRAQKAYSDAGQVPNARTMPSLEGMKIGSAKRSTVAIMFVDMVGFTRLVNQHRKNLENVLFTLDVFIPEMIQVARDFGGEFEKNTGDGIMVYFGTESPEPAEAARDAILAALWMHFATTNHINPLLKSLSLQQIRFRVGVDLGEMLISRLGIWGVNTITAIGPAANNAFRLQKKAGVDGIAIGINLYRVLPSDIKRWCRPQYAEPSPLFAPPPPTPFLDSILGATQHPQPNPVLTHYRVTERLSMRK